MINNSTEILAHDYLGNLLKGNRSNCSTITKQYLESNPSIIDLYENIFKVSLYEVGRLWEINKIGVATEHLATAITEGILNELFEQVIPKIRCDKKVVVACVENEQHQVGIKMVADVFEMNGWDSYFLGSGIPNTEFVRYIHEIKPDLIAISLSVYFNFNNLMKMLEILNGEFPDLPILVGGQALKNVIGAIHERLGGAIFVPDLYGLKIFIESLNSKF